MNKSIKQISGRINAARLSAWQLRGMAIVAAIAANVIILIVGRTLNGEFPMTTAGSDDQTVGFVEVIVVTGLVGLATCGLLALLERRTSRATAIWTAIALIVFALSLLGPLGSGVDASSKAVLTSMHIATAATLIPLMRRSANTGEVDRQALLPSRVTATQGTGESI